MPKIDLSHLPVQTGSGYPEPFCHWFSGRRTTRLGDAAGLTQFGVNLVRLDPGAMSSLRHWHEEQDEFLVVVEGVLTLRDDHGDTLMGVGDCAAFPKGDANGHHMLNTYDKPGAFIVVGTRTDHEVAHYSDVDMMVTDKAGKMVFTHRDGSKIATAVAEPFDFTAVGETLTGALIDRDFPAYRSIFHLPTTVVPRDGAAYTIETDEALRADFELYAQMIALHHVTDIFRVILSQTQTATDRMVVTTQVEMLSHANRVVEPFRTVFSLRHEPDLGWRIERIESSIGHINWTLGRAKITPSRTFDTD